MKAVLTVVEQVYHQLVSGQPTSATASYTLASESAEQVYVRRFLLPAGAEWVGLDPGWFRGQSCCLLLLQHRREPGLTTLTTASGVAVEVAFEAGPPAIRLYPGESCRFRPADLNGIRLRSLSSPAALTLTLFP